MHTHCTHCGGPFVPADVGCRFCGTARAGAFVPPAAHAQVAPADAEVARHIRDGQLLLAIKAYREAHRVDLRTAKEAVEALRDRLNSGR